MIPIPTPLCRGLAVLGLALLLAACQEPGATPAPPPQAHAAALARGWVEVEGGLRRVSAARPGRVERWLAEPGERVAAGQALAQLADAELRLQLAQAQSELQLLQAQSAARAALLPSARLRAERQAQAARQGLGAAQEADEAQAVLAELQAQLQADRAAQALARHKIELARLALAAAVVRSPAAGLLLERQAQIGDSVEAGQPLQQLLPALPTLVLAELGETFAGQVRPGMDAEVQAASAEGPVQRARVLRLGANFRAARAPEDGQAPGDQRVLEAVLSLEPGALKVGQKVLVRFLEPAAATPDNNPNNKTR
ncbi:HlyD family efflux transporter periplasmic adaptor subunit [Roseateles sp. DAIF2]|uniref:HlyD family efflux transporter periplasmic adaptor subunit n=1 Tax=Roseateles sp. DAIF2 TaxID=2714952 RepID=UPI0018A2F45E|nr:HlyD family efflux transporter periplasmic adaptor subunit [Roseateles sp. DAIF2]QPF75598.1 HlyD family efflux transporter periplasmic adaptor subunit [Roseateles sp. DAIF2]